MVSAHGLTVTLMSIAVHHTNMSFKEYLSEGPRIKRIRVRIRGGKVQRNVKKSGIKGYTFRGGRLLRMSTQEKMHRKRGARRGKIKRRAKLARSIMKRARSLRRLKSMGGLR